MDLQSNGGRNHIIVELQEIKMLLETGRQFFSDIVATYLNDYGIDVEEIRKQVSQKISIVPKLVVNHRD
jgi:hypothetical protein